MKRRGLLQGLFAAPILAGAAQAKLMAAPIPERVGKPSAKTCPPSGYVTYQIGGHNVKVPYFN